MDRRRPHARSQVMGWRSFLAASVVAVGVAALVQAPASAAAAGPTPTVEPRQQDELGQARRTGKPVEVAAETTETTRVMANPDGTFTLRSSAMPTRVRKDGAWREVDTTLVPHTDGTVT